jgi:peroxiredoxin
MALLPRHPVPQLQVPTLDGSRFVLGASPAPTFDMVVFYRGLHCPICAKYLTELARLLPEFDKR